jgi:hypothetical protein
LSQGSKKVSHLQKLFIVMEEALKETDSGGTGFDAFPKYEVCNQTLSKTIKFQLISFSWQ